MEVAGQWRREWAGTAEYGNVTEGGVTRRVARAMEVLQATGPGSRMRVLRAAYHSTTGSGAPAESFMIHSSRRVISSGSNFLDSPSFMSKPLEISSKPFEISSTPLESSPERLSESENYKVTEPDDTEISEPSKWRNSTGKSLRIPSEESSSTADNASIIDLDPRMNISKHTGLLRKYSFDSDSSEIQSKQSYKRDSTRTSPLLDTPVTLSTLKYKSLLNGSNDNWNDRRKSYSFEDTSPLSETILHKNDTLAMESSTDSGICKSTEIVNENSDEKVHHIHINKTDALYEPREGTFKEWLARNRHYKDTTSKPLRENYIIEEPAEDKVSLQSTGKVSIALPMNNQIDDRFQYMKNHINGDIDRRIKRVEFCKTELHFAAESGKVNIIATDEKPPPTNDFRRRRSAFVPIRDTFNKPVTLFGEKLDDFSHSSELDHHDPSDVGDSDENTAATKSILKNKIPKPKPYLLGENMVFVQDKKSDIESSVISAKEFTIPTAVSIINKQLQPEEQRYDKLASLSDKYTDNEKESNNPASAEDSHVFRPTNNGPLYDTAENRVNNYFQRFNSERNSFREDFKRFHNEVIETNNTNSVKQKLRNLQTSPVMQVNPKTRKLRESELTYFGVQTLNKKDLERSKKEENKWKFNDHKSIQMKPENEFQSVKLIQRVSNSVCNSEGESDETPEYQNIPLKSNFAPVPVPRTRTKGIGDFKANRFDDSNSSNEKVVIIKPVVEKSYQVCDSKAEHETRRTRRRQDTSTTASKSRSISEPPKYRFDDITNKSSQCQDYQRRIENTANVVSSSQWRRNKQKHVMDDIPALKYQNEEDHLPEQEALYVNLNVNKDKDDSIKLIKNPKKTSEYPSNRRSRKSSTERQEKIPHYGSDSIQDQNNGYMKSKTSRHTNSIDKHNSHNKTKTENDEVMSQNAKNSLHKGRKHREVITSSLTPDKVELKIDVKSPTRDNIQYSTNKQKQTTSKHSSRSSPKLKLSGSVEKSKVGKYDSHGKSTRVADGIDAKHDDTKMQRRDRSKSKENTERQDKIIIPERQYSRRNAKRGGVDSDSSIKPEKHKRSEYVINYDDKNGTVSSICKVKPGTSKKIIIHPEKIKESKSKTKSSDKTSLLQYQDQQWIHNGSIRHGDKKWKSRVHVQRNCQLL